MLLHLFDAISRDQILVRETEEEEEIEYESGQSSDDDEFRSRRRRRAAGAGAGADKPRQFVIHLFGTSVEGKTLCVEVRGFCPSFFVELPPTGNPDDHLNAVLRRMRPAWKVKGAVVRRKKMIGYTGGRSFVFVQLTVGSMKYFYEARKAFLDENQRPRMQLATGPPLRVYEANLDPMLRFFHTRGIAPCGWVSVNGTQVSETKIVCEWEDISPAASGEDGCVSAPLLVGAWDIECYSADGEFPMAKQGYRRIAKQLWAASSAAEAATMLETRRGLVFPEYRQGIIAPSAASVKRSVEGIRAELDAVWVMRAGAKTGKDREEGMVRLTAALDRAFTAWPLAGDPVIQIGTVAARGSAAPERHIFVLGGCVDIEGATVHRAATESELLLAWFTWVVEEDFDVLVGYNTFGFDEHYVWDRLEELRLVDEPVVQAMTRLEGGVVKLMEKMLSSSALGDNLLHLWTTPGRLRIDLYGHIKRKTQLSSYKLDSVCAAFLSGKLGGIEARGGGGKWFLKTKQTGDARVGRSLQILDDLGEELSEKMVIVGIEAGGLVVDSEEDLSAVTTAVRWAVVKDDVSPADIFRLHRGTDADRGTVAAYCIQDCDLVMELYKKLEVFNEAMSMANVCSVPVSYIFTRGQGIKIESLIFRFCAEVGQLVEVMPAAAYGKGAVLEVQDSYEGAIVLDPAAGFYGADTPVGVCDFASLYPSTIISENISHDMLVWTKDFALDGRFLGFRHGCDEDEALAPPGTRFTDIEFDIWRPAADDARKHPVKLRAGTRICRFAQPPGDVKGSLPNIVAKLLAARKAKREELKKTADPFKKALLDAEQNAYKITANSLYGQLGSGTFKIRLQHLAASVTAYGRKQILFAQAAIQQFYGPEAGDPRCAAEGAKVVYGDSVLGDTPLYCRLGGAPFLSRIDELVGRLSTNWEPWRETKEAVETTGLEVWTESSWTRVNRLLRHKLAPGKKIWRILTHTGVVDCTEDHSLVAADGSALQPGSVIVGTTSLLHNSEVGAEFSRSLATADTPSVKEAWAMGFFLADGSADVYQCPSGQKATWAINKSNMEPLLKAQECLPFETKILDTLASSGVYKLIAQGDVKTQAARYRALFYNEHREKRVPPCILNAPLDVMTSFMDGFYTGDGDKDVNDYVRWDQKGKEVSAGLYILARRMDFSVSFNDRTGKDTVFRMTLTKKTQRKSPTIVKRMRELPATDVEYVYDLDTANHHFAVGPGALVVHNTDSLFVNFNPRNPETGARLTGREARVATIELTEEAGKFITGALKAPHDFEYDKVFSPFLIFSKKRYVGNKYEESPDEFKETSMGIVLKRRDNAPLLKIIYSAALNRMLNHGDVAGAVDCVKRGVGELVAGRTKLSQLTITKSLRSEYLTPTPPAHKVLADRMAARDPGNAPASGERLGYVYIQAPVGQLASKLQGDRVETPAWIVAHGLQADARHYIEHQLMVPLGELFGIVVEQMPGFVGAPAGGWSDDVDKRADQRAIVAQDLLFREGLAALDAAARRAFVGRMGSAAGPAAQVQELRVVRPGPRPGSRPAPAPVKQTQTSLTQFMKPRDTALIDDGFIAASMGRSQAAKKAAKPKADGTVMALML